MTDAKLKQVQDLISKLREQCNNSGLSLGDCRYALFTLQDEYRIRQTNQRVTDYKGRLSNDSTIRFIYSDRDLNDQNSNGTETKFHSEKKD